MRTFCAMLAIVFELWLMVGCVRAATLVVEQQRDTLPAQSVEPADSIMIDTDYDYGWVDQGSREGAWKYTAVTLSYLGNKKISPYFFMETWDRFRQRDYTLNAGSYLRFSDRGSLHAEIGFGVDRDYLYQTLVRLEAENVLAGRWNWCAGMRYQRYPENDVYIVSPGLIYYWGDNYLQVLFNDGFTESRGSAQSGQVKAQVAVFTRLSAYGGVAMGERLFDIFLLPAREQNGYIIFCGVKYQLSEKLAGRLGFSYSQEDPQFIKRSIDAGLTLEF